MAKLSSSLVLHLGVIGLTLAPGLARAQQVVGVVGAANAAPTGRAPGKSQRILKAGSEIYFKDRIVTKRGGSAQLAFLDRSTLNVSENSDLVIDEFVYQPGESGTMTAHLSKGVMRFVGGAISHESGATFKTPVVTIGIRGGIGTIGYVENAKDLATIPGVPANFHGGAIVVNGYGTMTVRNGTSETVISRPGFAVFVGGANEAIAAPVRFEMASAKALMSALSSRPGQRGGLSQKGATAVSATVGVARFSVPVAVPRAPGVNALDFTSIFHVGNSLARNRSQAQQAIRLQMQIVTMPNSVTPISPAPGSSPTGGKTATGPVGGGTFDRPNPSAPIGRGTQTGSTQGEPIGPGTPTGSTPGGPVGHNGGSRGGYDNGIGNGGRNNGQGNGGNQSGHGNGGNGKGSNQSGKGNGGGNG